MNVRPLLQSALLVLLISTPMWAQDPATPGSLAPVTSPSATANGHHHAKNAWQAAVGLTPEQRKQVKPLQKAFKGQNKALRQQFQTNMEAILTPAQATQMAQIQSDAKANHEHVHLRQIEGTLGLSGAQLDQVKTLRQQMKTQRRAARQQFVSQVQPLLTPDQQVKLTQYFQAHRGRV